MLDVLYIALVAAPLTMAAAALLLLALRSLRGHTEERDERRQAELERARTTPGGLRKRADPLAEPASIASMSDLRAIGRSVVGALANDPRPPVDSLAFPPREVVPVPVPAPATERVGASAPETKRCPDCAEEILAAARVCKHCRCRFDEPDFRQLIA